MEWINIFTQGRVPLLHTLSEALKKFQMCSGCSHGCRNVVNPFQCTQGQVLHSWSLTEGSKPSRHTRYHFSIISKGVETKEEAKMREKQQREREGCTLEHMNIPEGLQLVESTHQSRFFLTATAVHGQIRGAEEVWGGMICREKPLCTDHIHPCHSIPFGVGRRVWSEGVETEEMERKGVVLMFFFFIFTILVGNKLCWFSFK